jgi:hypothetical protein
MTTAAIVYFDYSGLVIPFKDPSSSINPSTALILWFHPSSIGKAREFSRCWDIGHER